MVTWLTAPVPQLESVWNVPVVVAVVDRVTTVSSATLVALPNESRDCTWSCAVQPPAVMVRGGVANASWLGGPDRMVWVCMALVRAPELAVTVGIPAVVSLKLRLARKFPPRMVTVVIAGGAHAPLPWKDRVPEFEVSVTVVFAATAASLPKLSRVCTTTVLEQAPATWFLGVA